MQSSAEQTTNSNEDDALRDGERREGKDRRKRPTPMFSRFLFVGRRRWNRRATDPRERYYVDRFGKKAWVAAIVILALCGADAVFTVYHLTGGATEANPIVAFMMAKMGIFWPVVKYLMTATGLFFLLIHKNFTLARVSTVVIVAMYGVLMFYHLSPFLGW